MKTRILLSLLVMISATSCGNKKSTENPVTETKDLYGKIKSMDWMLGKWTMGNGDTLSIETWEMKNDSVFYATSMDVKAGKDTLRYENITIEQRGSELFYIPVVKGQNNGKPVEFKHKVQESYPVKGSEVVFENIKHDFPQRIMYQLLGDTLFASISGPMDGHDVVMRFPMVKAK
jgi:hypothetical protein